MKTRDQILAEVINIVSEHLRIPIHQITINSKIVDDLGADSLDIVEMIMMLEEHCEIAIPDSVASQLRTIGDIVTFIVGLQNNIDTSDPRKNVLRKQKFIMSNRRRNIQKRILRNTKRKYRF